MLTQPQIQNVRNLALLARQAIANGFASMQADPRMMADLCQSVEALQAEQDSPSLQIGLDVSAARSRLLARVGPTTQCIIRRRGHDVFVETLDGGEREQVELPAVT